MKTCDVAIHSPEEQGSEQRLENSRLTLNTDTNNHCIEFEMKHLFMTVHL